MVKDGVEGAAYDKITLPLFSPDSLHMSYMAQKDGKWLVVVDRKEGKSYNGVSIIAFSPDSQHLAYAALSQGTWFVVVDGEEGVNRFSAIVKGSSLVFTDTTHLHTLALNLSGQEFVNYEIEIRDRL